MIECKHCSGTGWFDTITTDEYGESEYSEIMCTICDGLGVVDE